MSFSTIYLRHHLNSDDQNVLADFYRPVISTARKYDRATSCPDTEFNLMI
jgi:hypothetical protein